MSRDLVKNFVLLVTAPQSPLGYFVFIGLACMVRVAVRVTTKVSVWVRDLKPILRDCLLASELVQARHVRRRDNADQSKSNQKVGALGGPFQSIIISKG